MNTTKTLDWKAYERISADTVAEGIVMLKNDRQALPLPSGAKVSVFGRIQMHYYKSGTGSGGMVNVARVINIVDGLKASGKVRLNEELIDIYEQWDLEHPFDRGEGWGSEPWAQAEMPLSDEVAARAAACSDTAIVILGRTAGEEQDNREEPGAWLLTDTEDAMLATVRKHFSKMIVLLNVGGIFDMSFVDKYDPEAVLYVWQGGMMGGLGTAAVLTGESSPSGKLPDTIAYSVSDYPSAPYFGDIYRDFYCEDIYVGYRYFETFARKAVRYPFGFGLSYTDFSLQSKLLSADTTAVSFAVTVKNIGKVSGKEVVQIYCEAPQGKLGKPARVLCAYEKTPALAANETCELHFSVLPDTFSSFDDSGITGHKACRLLEAGEYRFYIGADVRSATYAGSLTLSETLVLEQLHSALTPVLPFDRIRPDTTASADNTVHSGTASDAFNALQSPYLPVTEPAPIAPPSEEMRRLANMPTAPMYTGNTGILLQDVFHGNHTMDEFLAQLTNEELACIVRGEGMGSPKVTAGTASAFGGVSEALAAYGIPCACCSDGPSGMRLDSGARAFSLPNGTLIASTFNRPLITELFSYLGIEMVANKVDCLLGPGMNIHRHPLNGRNFEYFSEDPYLTGTIAVAELDGLHSAGVTGTIKHFCGNNQETGRHTIDSVISERALREIYLRGFEIAIKAGGASSIMTTYGSVNGLYTAGSYDLTTTILRQEWGFSGIAMTDWWANINVRNQAPDKRDFAAMVRAQNDLYMVCSNGASHDDNTLEALAQGTLTRAELCRCAENICSFLLHTHAMKRMLGEETTVEITGQEYDTERSAADAIDIYPLEHTLTLPLDEIDTRRGSTHSFTLEIMNPGTYRVTLTASSELSELAQIPVTLFSLGTASGTFTWNGTQGKPVSYSKEVPFFSHFTSIRLYFAQSGLKMHSIAFELIE
ncbi:MAG: glycoside hydrolase family 3 protein [Lachnospiraceae bacterium]|nr:glycoside hydrolase family 3 protein [Lachnospiraceae bacterium]